MNIARVSQNVTHTAEDCSSGKEASMQSASTIAKLQEEISSLKEEVNKGNLLMKKFLNDEQISALDRTPSTWSSESIIRGLKLRFSLGIHGYNYLRSTNYPTPSYTTLTKRIRHIQMSFGVFEHLLEPLQCKIQALDPLDRICILSIDEMEISGDINFDKHKSTFCGNITLGDSQLVGNHLTVVLMKGVKSPWKQVIACEVTGPSTKGSLQKELIENCITFVDKCGLRVIALSSDMGSNNRAMWSSLGVEVTRNESQRNVKFEVENDVIYVVPDVCHLLKNLKSAVLNSGLTLPLSLVQNEELPSNFVSGQYILQLWHSEISKSQELRLLHHLHREDVEPSHFSKMNVGSAVRFFSTKTAAGLEMAVKLKMLPPEALTTAYFCRLIEQWFCLCSSKISKAGITSKNKVAKFQFLKDLVDIFQNIEIGKGWKPLNTGMIMSTLSLWAISNDLLNKGYKFVLLHRFTQDALENIFSQIRRKAGSSPSALECKRALKLITVSQFISDVKRSSYMSDSDLFLIDHVPSVVSKQNTDSNTVSPGSSLRAVTTSVPTKPGNLLTAIPVSVAAPSTPISLPSVSHSASNVIQPEYCLQFTAGEDLKSLTLYERNSLCNIGGSTTNAMLKKKICSNCKQFLNEGVNPDRSSETLVDFLSLGGLKKPNREVLELIYLCEILYRKNKQMLLHNDAKYLIDSIVHNVPACIPVCCDLKKKLSNTFSQ